MSPDDTRMDDLLDQARPPLLVSVAAAILALAGLMMMTTGLQATLFLNMGGIMGLFPYALLGCGALSIAAAFGMGKISATGGLAALLLSGLSVLLAGVWAVYSLLHLVFSPAVVITAMLAPLAFLLVVVAIFPFRRCVKARKELKKELEGTVPGGGGLGMVAAVVGVGVIAVVVFLGLQGGGRGDHKVVGIVLRGEIDADADGRLAEGFAYALRDFGLEAVVVEERLAADEPFDAARSAAAKAGAGHTVVLDLATQTERDGVLPGTYLHVVTCSAAYASSAQDGEVVSEPLEFAFERHTVSEVATNVRDAWVDALSPWVIEQVYGSEPFQDVLAQDVDFEQMTAAIELASQEDWVWDRAAMAQGYDDWCGLETERLAAMAAGELHPTQCFGDPCGQYTLIGVDESGRAIVQDGSRVPMFKIPLTATNSWTEPPERVFAVDPADPGTEHDLLRSGNFYDFGKLDPNGQFASLETFGADGTEAILTVDLLKGQPKDIALLQPRERTSWVRSAPGGNGAVVKIKRGSRMLVSADRRVELPEFGLAWWVETADGWMIAGQLDSGDVALSDQHGELRRGRVRVRGSVVSVFSAGPDELAILEKDAGQCTLVTARTDHLTVLERNPLPQCIRSPRMLPDGRLIGVANVTSPGDVPGDREVVIWAPADPELTPLTRGSYVEETVYATPDGGRLLFNRRLEDWPSEYDTRTYRRLVCSMELPD